MFSCEAGGINQLMQTPYFATPSYCSSTSLPLSTCDRPAASAWNESVSSSSAHNDSGFESSFHAENDFSTNNFSVESDLSGASFGRELDCSDCSVCLEKKHINTSVNLRPIMNDGQADNLDFEDNQDKTAGKRRRHPRVVRPSEDEFNERVAAKVVGRLVIKQTTPKYRITYNEILRRVSPPEQFNVSALITLFRIKKDAESSRKIMSVLKEVGYDLRKGRRMNRRINRFSSLVEEEAMEFGRDFERIHRAYFPFQSASRVFLERIKNRYPADALTRRLQKLRTFYAFVRSIIDSDRTPLAFYKTPPNSIVLNPQLQERLGRLTRITHGFSLTAYSGLANVLTDLAEQKFTCCLRNTTKPGGCSLISESGSYIDSQLNPPSRFRQQLTQISTHQWNTSENLAILPSSYSGSCRMTQPDFSRKDVIAANAAPGIHPPQYNQPSIYRPSYSRQYNILRQSDSSNLSFVNQNGGCQPTLHGSAGKRQCLRDISNFNLIGSSCYGFPY